MPGLGLERALVEHQTGALGRRLERQHDHRFLVVRVGFFPDERVDEATRRLDLAELAAEVPPRHVTPFTLMAGETLSEVLNLAVRHAREHGMTDLEQVCRALLDDASAEGRKRIEFGGTDR